NGRGAVIAAPLRKKGRERGAVEIVTPWIEQDNRSARWDHVSERDRFLENTLVGVGRAAFPDLDNFKIAEAKLPAGLRGALGVTSGKLSFRSLLQASNRGNDNSHRADKCIRSSAPCPSTFSPGHRNRALRLGRRGQSRRQHRS